MECPKSLFDYLIDMIKTCFLDIPGYIIQHKKLEPLNNQDPLPVSNPAEYYAPYNITRLVLSRYFTPGIWTYRYI